MKKQNIVFITFIGISIFGSGLAYAQYGGEASNPEHQSMLKELADQAKAKSAQNNNSTSNTFPSTDNIFEQLMNWLKHVFSFLGNSFPK